MGWDVPTQTVIRNNGRYTGSTVWNSDATISDEDIDSLGHDTHDQDLAQAITECLNKNGVNTMLADLNVGGFKVVAMADGVAATDAVTVQQLTPVSNKADANEAAITALGVKSVVQSFKSNGPIAHVLDDQGAGAATIDVSSFNRHRVQNDGALTLTFDSLPAADDPDLGANWVAEGSIKIRNGATPGTITIAGLVGAREIGVQRTDADVDQVLSYVFQRVAGVNEYTLIWSN